MEQRLIDANRLIAYLQENYIMYDHMLADIDAQPTVDAIPIEWINEWVNNYCDWNQEQLIECLLRTWSKNGGGGGDAKID